MDKGVWGQGLLQGEVRARRAFPSPRRSPEGSPGNPETARRHPRPAGSRPCSPPCPSGCRQCRPADRADGRPGGFPAGVALARPDGARSTRRSRSNRVTALMTFMVVFPAGLVRSTPPKARQWTRMSVFSSSATVPLTSMASRPGRSSLVTMRTSPSSIWRHRMTCSLTYHNGVRIRNIINCQDLPKKQKIAFKSECCVHCPVISWKCLSRRTFSDHPRLSICLFDRLHIVQRPENYGYILRTRHRKPA